MLKDFLTVSQAAAKSGLSTKQISLLLRRGTIKGHKVARDWLVEERSLGAYMANRPKPGPKKS